MIGIVILTYNNWCDTIQCVDSILKSNINEKYHIYIVDNASKNKAPEDFVIFCHSNHDISLLHSSRNLGYSGGNNIGIKKAIEDNCTTILLSNNDVVFYPGSIDAMSKFLTNEKDYGIVGPKTYKLDGTIQKYNMAVKTGMKEKYLIRTHMSIFFPSLVEKYWGLNLPDDQSCDMYALNGCCFMVHRRCFDFVFPLDDNVFLFEEEFITGIRMEKSHYKTRYLAESEVLHKHGQSTKSISGFSLACQYESELYYCKVYLDANFFKILPLYLMRICYYTYLYFRFPDFRGSYLLFLKKTCRMLMRTRKSITPHTHWK